MVAIVLVVLHVLGFASSIHAVITTRTSPGTLSWRQGPGTIPCIAVRAARLTAPVL